MLENIGLAQSKATDLDGKPLFKDDQAFRDHMSQVLPETVSSPGLSGSTAASQAEVEKDQDVMSQTVVSQPTGLSTTVSDDFFDQFDTGSGSGSNGGSSNNNKPPAQPTVTTPDVEDDPMENIGAAAQPTFNNQVEYDADMYNEGGLMAVPKKKKKRQPKKGGLAGKK